MTAHANQDFARRVHAHLAKEDSDLFVFSGSVVGLPAKGTISERFVDLVLAKKDRRKNAALFLTTYGGDPDAAYRIARSLKRHYDSFRLIVVGPCKSAGTLIALGADVLTVGPTGELGPLDVQMAKPDELMLSGSGLEIFSALNIVTSHAFDRFEDYMILLSERSGGAISTKTASDLAVKLVTGLLGPIAGHIDPLRLGEAQRAIDIAKAYGNCLGLDNLRPRALDRLVEEYPSHSFVIDAEQVEELFHNVTELGGVEKEIAQDLERILRYPAPKDGVIFDAETYYSLSEEKSDEHPATSGVAADPSPNGGGAPRVPRPSTRIDQGNGLDPHPQIPVGAENGGPAITPTLN